MKTRRAALAVVAGLGLWLAGGSAGAVDRCTRRCEDDAAAFSDICKQHAGKAKGQAKCQKLCADAKKKCLEECEEQAKAPPANAPAQGSGGAK